MLYYTRISELSMAYSSDLRKAVIDSIQSDKELMNFINDNPEAFLSEIAERFNVTQACISITLKNKQIS